MKRSYGWRGAVAAGALAVLGLGAAPARADTGWHSVASPFVPGGTLAGVAAMAPGDAWAVGTYYHIGSTVFDHPRPVMQRWTGSGWQGYPLPNGLYDASLDAVAATSRTDAWAAGYTSSAYQVGKNWILHWDGTSWTQVHIAEGDDGAAGTASVDARPGNVWVSFDYHEVFRVSGGSAERVPLTGPAQEISIARIRVGDGAGTWAAGRHGHWDGQWAYYPDTAQWDGRTWTEHPINVWPATARATDVLPLGAGDVWAIGQSDDPSVPPFLAHWDGTAWRNVPLPGAGPATRATLAPDGRGGAYASGMAGDVQGAPMVLHLDPATGAWSRVEIPQSAGTWNSVLTGLSVTPGGTAMWGVGKSALGTLVMTTG
ncbi:hypothetical protein [Actinomadura sp. NTSP31]|uniref:hypothetical protein n=1 Tax=Actinomadura sp. NTSP31 TaxID=1735447 RepID=UPI0035C0770C